MELSPHSKEVAGSTPLGRGLFIVCLRVPCMSEVGDSKVSLGMTASVCLSVSNLKGFVSSFERMLVFIRRISGVHGGLIHIQNNRCHDAMFFSYQMLRPASMKHQSAYV